MNELNKLLGNRSYAEIVEAQSTNRTPSRCPECYHPPHTEQCIVKVVVWKDGVKGSGLCGCEHDNRSQ